MIIRWHVSKCPRYWKPQAQPLLERSAAASRKYRWQDVPYRRKPQHQQPAVTVGLVAISSLKTSNLPECRPPKSFPDEPPQIELVRDGGTSCQLSLVTKL